MSIQALNADALIAPVAAAAVIVADLTMAVNAVGARPGHAASEIAAAWQPSRCTVDGPSTREKYREIYTASSLAQR